MAVNEYATLTSNEELEKLMVAQNNLLKQGADGLVKNLTENINQYDTAYFVKRIIFFAEKERNKEPFASARFIDDVEDKYYQEELYRIIDANKSIKDGIIISTDNTADKQKIKRIIREDIFGNRTNFTRDKVFILAVALNLDYGQTMELLLKASKERIINYKNPYEVMLMFYIKKHENVYNSYTKLRNAYEQISLRDEIRKDLTTLDYANSYKHVSDEESLLNFVCDLPNTSSKSAYDTFGKGLGELVERLTDDDVYARIGDHLISLIYNEEDSVNFLATFVNISDDVLKRLYHRVSKEKQEDKKRYINNAILEDLFGSTSIRKGDIVFDFLSKAAWRAGDLRQLAAGTRHIRRNDIITLYFYKYIAEGYFENILDFFGYKTEYIIEFKNEDIIMLQRIFDNFKAYINEALIKSGFGEFYLPNPYEGFLMRCLLTDDPLNAYRTAVQMKN